MARRTDDTAFTKFLEDLLSHVDESKREAVKEALGTSDTQKHLRAGVLAQAEFSRSMDSQREDQTALEASKTEAREKIDRWTEWYGKANQEAATHKALVEKYKAEYGELGKGDGENRTVVAGPTKDEVQAQIEESVARLQSNAVSVAVQLTDLQSEHRQRFGERLDVEALLKFAGEKDLKLPQAYTSFTAEAAAEKTKEEFDAAIKVAREEGAKEALSNVNLPMLPNASIEPHVLDLAADAAIGKTESERVANAIARFNTQVAKGPQPDALD